MSNLMCTGCGSQLTLPEDPTAVEATCQFCGVKTLLPDDLVHLREESFEEKLELEERQQERVERLREELAEKEVEAKEQKSTTLGVAVVIAGAMLVFALGTVIAIAKNAHQKPVAHPATHATHPASHPH